LDGSIERLPPLLFGATGVLLVVLPLLRAAAGGPGWSAALATGQIRCRPWICWSRSAAIATPANLRAKPRP
jgi:hypothetical protein